MAKLDQGKGTQELQKIQYFDRYLKIMECGLFHL